MSKKLRQIQGLRLLTGCNPFYILSQKKPIKHRENWEIQFLNGGDKKIKLKALFSLVIF